MRDALKIFIRYLPKYKNYITLNVVFNLLSALFSVFSVATIIPILKFLLENEKLTNTYKTLELDFSKADSLKEAIMNNLYAMTGEFASKYGAASTILLIGIFLVFMVFFKTGFTYFASFAMAKIRNHVVRDIRNQIYDKIISLPISFFTEEKKGDIMARTSGDIAEVENSVINSLNLFFKNPIIIITMVAAMIFMSWQLTLFVFILFPVAGAIIGFIGRSLRKKSMSAQTKLGQILSTIEETLSGLRIIKAFNAEQKMTGRMDSQNEDYRGIMDKVMSRNYLASPISEFLGTIVMVVVMWYGSRLIINNTSSLDSSQFLGYLLLFYSIINPTKAFSNSFYNIQKGLAAMDRIDVILNTKTDIIEAEHPQPIEKFEHQIEYKDVSFRYQTEYVLEDINLKIPKGKTIALVGQSGSGKSTMVDLLPRFYDVIKGSITIDDTDVRKLRIQDLRNLLGIVNQEPILFNDSFFNNISFGVKNATLKEVVEAAKVANAHEFIENTEQGYDTHIGDRGSKLSGGQRQRISIARAVLKNPPILILDEATSALDTESERLVQDALTKLMQNRTSIVIAHRLSTIVHADEICVLKEGRIVERGKHDELLAASGEYSKFYELQNFGNSK